MSHVVLKPTPKPERSTMDGLYDATESLWMSIQRSLSTRDDTSKSKKYARGLFY
jgi:hypothetical protein